MIMMQQSLGLNDERARSVRLPLDPQRDLFGQYMTPLWIAEAIIERYFSDLDHGAAVIEPSCGDGRFLDAFRSLRPDIDTVGVEIDPVLARIAAEKGHNVRTGDFTDIDIDLIPDAIVGNPPFEAKIIDQFLAKSYTMLRPGGRAGFILPAYYFQTASSVEAMRRRWSISAEQIPRSIFPGLRALLTFAIFSKDKQRSMVGFAFYETAAAVQRFAHRYRELVTAGNSRARVSVWRQVVSTALQSLGGEADLALIYAEIEGKRPTPNPFWKEKVRQIVQRDCTRTARGRYAIKS
jgi:hypothetical protein